MDRILILMRHAKSDWNQSGLSDKERPLNARGNEAAPRMARWMLEQRILPDRVCCSVAVRTRETLQWMLREWKIAGESEPEENLAITYVDGLYLAPSHAILGVATETWRQYPETRVLLVLGHNPGMEELVSALDERTTSMPTAAIAVFLCSFENRETPFVPTQFLKTHFQTPKKLADRLV